jgi:hypothetical protein
MRFYIAGIKFQFALDNMADVWINYNVMVHLLQGHGYLHSDTGKSKCIFRCYNQSYFYRSCFCLKDAEIHSQNSDSLQAGCSEVQMLIGARFLDSQNNYEDQPDSCTMHIELVSWRWNSQGLALIENSSYFSGHVFKELCLYFHFVPAWHIMGHPLHLSIFKYPTRL